MTTTLAAMQFKVSEPDIVVNVGDAWVRLFFVPMFHVQTSDGRLRAFESRIKADLFFAEQVRKLRYWHGFDQYVDRLPHPQDPDERRGYLYAAQCEAYSDEAAAVTAHQERIRHGAW